MKCVMNQETLHGTPILLLELESHQKLNHHHTQIMISIEELNDQNY